MGWETRKGGSYYYMKERIGSHVVSRYIGKGEFAKAIAHEEAVRREISRIERDVEAELQAFDEVADRLSDEAFEALDSFVSATLIAAGFHRHKGTWRKQRDGKSIGET